MRRRSSLRDWSSPTSSRAALGYGGRLVWDVSRDDPSIVPLLERALAAIGEEESPLRVRLLPGFGRPTARLELLPRCGKRRSRARRSTSLGA